MTRAGKASRRDRSIGVVRSLVVLAGLWLLIGLASAPGAGAERYVAMGDSYSAGTGSSSYDLDESCQRSSKAYAPLIKNDLGAGSSFRFIACSGAVINHIISSTQGANPVQSNVLGADTLDVTVSIGGNDAGFGDVLLKCGYPMVSCDGDIDTAQAYIRNQMPARLDAAYDRIRLKAPNARVGVVGYPRLFPANGDDCSAATFFSAGEIARLNQTADLLADVARERARAHGFTFVDSRPAFFGHAWCEDEWINGLSNPTNKSYHPNDRGYVGYAGIVRAAMLAAPDPAFAPGPNGRIAFSSNRDGNAEIYVINGNGAFPIDLTQNSAADRDPVFSPDGTRIAFASNRDGDYEIYTMASTGGAVTKLTSNTTDDLEPSWAPNGRQIAFRSVRDGNNEIYKMSSTGSGQTRLTNNSASDFAPSFSPDGSEIVFQRYTAGSAVGQGNEIYKMNADGQGQINLTANAASVNDGAPEWSPDGARIAFHSNRDGNLEIYTMTATGSSVTRRTSNGAEDRNPAWSPSGSHIVFESDRDGSSQVYTMTNTGSGQTRRTTGTASEQAPSWQGDARPPETTIESAPPASSNNPVGNFTFGSDEPGSTFECRLDSAVFQTCSSPLATDPLGDGSHTFAVRAKDPSGNVDPTPATHSFAIDTAGKLTEITAGPSGQTNFNEPVFEFVSEDAAVTFQCRLNPGADLESGWASCDSPYSLGQLSDGQYRFEVRGTDGVGNVETPPQRRDFTVDTVPPDSTVTFGPAPVGVDRNPVFEFTADQPGSTFQCRLDGDAGGQWTACESPWAASALPDGQHRFEVRSIDQAGNLEPAPAAVDFRVDTTTPSTAITSGPGAAEPSADVSFEFSADEPGVRYECRLDSFDDSDWAGCASPRSYTGLNHGRHSFQVRAIDQAGNVETPPITSEFGVKTDPGLEIISGPTSASSETDPAIAFTAEDPDMDFECRLNSDDEADWRPCSSPFRPGAVEPLADGQYSFELRGTDWFESTKPEGQREKVSLAPYTWTVMTAAPQPSVVRGPATLDNSRTATFEVDSGWGADTVECQIDGLAWTPCDPAAAPGTRLQTVTYTGLHDGSHRFRLRASNPLFGAGPEVTFDWVVDAIAPEAKIDRGPARRTASSNANWEFSGAAGSGSYRCRVDGAPPIGSAPAGNDGFGSCASPLTLTAVADGEHKFELVAVDDAGNLSPVVSRLWSVDTVGPTTTISAGPPVETTAQNASFSFAADDSPATFDCRVDRSDWRPCLSPFVLDRLSVGDHRFEVRALDSLGNIGEPVVFDWKIKASGRPTIRFKPKAKLARAGRAVVAELSCPADAPCAVTAPAQVRFKVGARRIAARVIAPRRLAAGGRAQVQVSFSRAARRALGRRNARLRLRLTVTPASAAPLTVTGSILIRP